MFETPHAQLAELHQDAATMQVLLDSGLLAPADQVNLANQIRGLNNSIAFIEKMGV